MHLSIKIAAKISSTPQNPVFLHLPTKYPTKSTIHSTKKTALPFYIRISHYDHNLNTKTNSATPKNLPNVPSWTVPKITIDTDLFKYDKKQIDHNTFKLMFYELVQRYQVHTHIYTDGSKTQNGTGYAIVVEHSIIKVKLHHDTSILTAKVNVLKHALEITTKYHNTRFAIFCDSTSAIASVSNQWTDSTTIYECQNTYIESTKNNNSITLV